MAAQTELESFTIDDPIQSPLTYAVEVSLLLTNGDRRWCCFATPQSLSTFGDFLGDTKSRIHYGLPHMIVLESLSPATISSALKQIDQHGSIREISKPIESDGKCSQSDVWVFNGTGSNFASGIFRAKSNAERWIEKHGLSGTLTRYPVDVSVYDWATEYDLFTPKQDYQSLGEFIGRFTSAYQEHYHYDNGESPA